jgi:thiol:disulfide interchange protein DsbC
VPPGTDVIFQMKDFYMNLFSRVRLSMAAFAVAALAASSAAWASEAAIRKALTERFPNLPKIDEISRTPMNNLWEVRVNGADLFYTDADGNFLIQGSVIDTKSRVNLTEERVNKLTAIDVDKLPLKDAFTIVRGNGKRKLVVFEDPSCGYCKRFERDLLNINDVTVHMFLYPILGPKSDERSKNIWCAKDRAKVWNDWMVKDIEPPAATCDVAAIDRNVELGRKYKITGTPTLFFAGGHRVPGAVPAARIEQMLTDPK